MWIKYPNGTVENTSFISQMYIALERKHDAVDKTKVVLVKTDCIIIQYENRDYREEYDLEHMSCLLGQEVTHPQQFIDWFYDQVKGAK